MKVAKPSLLTATLFFAGVVGHVQCSPNTEVEDGSDPPAARSKKQFLPQTPPPTEPKLAPETQPPTGGPQAIIEEADRVIQRWRKFDKDIAPIMADNLVEEYWSKLQYDAGSPGGYRLEGDLPDRSTVTMVGLKELIAVLQKRIIHIYEHVIELINQIKKEELGNISSALEKVSNSSLQSSDKAAVKAKLEEVQDCVRECAAQKCKAYLEVIKCAALCYRLPLAVQHACDSALDLSGIKSPMQLARLQAWDVTHELYWTLPQTCKTLNEFPEACALYHALYQDTKAYLHPQTLDPTIPAEIDTEGLSYKEARKFVMKLHDAVQRTLRRAH